MDISTQRNAPHNHRGLGYESIDSYGFTNIIVGVEGGKPKREGGNTRTVYKHRWLWEKLHGPIPNDMMLKCLDGNKQNTDPSNWIAMLDDLYYGFDETRRERFPEGHPYHSPNLFVAFFCGSHKGCQPDSFVTRLEYEFL